MHRNKVETPVLTTYQQRLNTPPHVSLACSDSEGILVLLRAYLDVSMLPPAGDGNKQASMRYWQLETRLLPEIGTTHKIYPVLLLYCIPGTTVLLYEYIAS